jgi:hypothetical protein
MKFVPLFSYLSLFEDNVSSHVFISTFPTNVQNRKRNCSIAGLQTVEHPQSRTAEEHIRHLWLLKILMRLMMMVINIITIRYLR